MHRVLQIHAAWYACTMPRQEMQATWVSSSATRRLHTRNPQGRGGSGVLTATLKLAIAKAFLLLAARLNWAKLAGERKGRRRTGVKKGKRKNPWAISQSTLWAKVEISLALMVAE